jgi:uncharacterized protein (DUF885 family)
MKEEAAIGGGQADSNANQDPGSHPASAASNSPTDANFEQLYGREWQWRERQLPEAEDRNGPIGSRLPPVDPESQAMRTDYWDEVSRELAAIPRERLSGPNRINYDVYRRQIDTLTARQYFRNYEMPLDSDTMFWTEFSRTARRPFKNSADYHNWIAQMREIPGYFNQQVEQMRAGLRRGFTPPQVTLAGRDQSILNVAESAPEDTFFFVPFRQMLASVAVSEAQQLQGQAAETIRNLVQPAYAELLAFVRDEYVPGTRTTLAARDLPDGEAYYQSLIREFTTLDLSPQAIHDIGVAEIAQLDEQMQEVMSEIGTSGGLGEFLQQLRNDPQFYARTPEQLLHRAAWIAKAFDGKAGQFFGHLPRARFAIRPVPDDLAPFYTSGRGGPDAYLLNTYDLPHRPLYHLTALTLHESAPGHSFQIALSMEEQSLPDFRRHTYISAFGEGWALYCEWLGQEMGMYETPYDQFGMLSYQSWRAARLVIDTGLHSLGWTREQALGYLRDHTALPEHEIETEVDRYISNPAQALAYYLGEMVVREVRTKAQSQLGDKFNLRAFHDTVLQLGSVPLCVLRGRIDQFIEAGGGGPYPEEE